MAELISLVSGDNLANVQVNLVREDTGAVFDLNGGTLNLYVRKKGTTAVLATIPHNVILSARSVDGLVVFSMGTFTASAIAGYYEGEVEITKNPGSDAETKQTVFQHISFLVRDDFTS